MIWNKERETCREPELEALQIDCCASRWHASTRTCPSTGRLFRARGIRPEDVRSLDDLRRLPFTRKARLSRQLSLWPAGRAAQAGGAHPRLQRHHRQAHRRGLHPQGHGYLARGLRPQPGCRRCHRRRYGADRHGLRPVHRRPRLALWLASTSAPPWCPCRRATPSARSCSSRISRCTVLCLHAVLRHLCGRAGRRDGRGPAPDQAARGHPRRRALVRGDAPRDRATGWASTPSTPTA